MYLIENDYMFRMREYMNDVLYLKLDDGHCRNENAHKASCAKARLKRKRKKRCK